MHRKLTELLLSACPALVDLPALGSLNCMSCDEPWPCPPALLQLAELSRTRRAVLLVHVLALAADREVPAPQLGSLYRRIILDPL